MTKFYIETLDKFVDESATSIIHQDVTAQVKNDSITVHQVLVRIYTATGEEIYDRDLAQQVDQQLFTTYAKNHNLLTTYEIKAIRQELGLSQRGFANLLGFSKSTIEQYEAGSIPTKVNNDLITQLKSPIDSVTVQRLFKRSDKSKYSANDLKKINKILGEKYKRAPFDKASDIADWFIAQNYSQLYLDKRASKLTQMKLQKLLYFAQGIFLNKYQRLLYNEDTLAFEHGPVYQSVMNRFHGQRELKILDDPNANLLLNLAHFQEKVNEDIEIAGVLNYVWAHYNAYEAAKLRKITHLDESAWSRTYVEGSYRLKIPNEEIIAEFAHMH
ncbi:type II TA system antitoxin MqsA family protein [Convivina intestini]|uniref:type II TA system antitoxin MqsA family protein n=1 Tax=Convivina intestini TaxID=1505726 RepID=UPI00200FC230|nr:type II TA system antitoxin MqsA family protein [Convivina intestini]CAH1851847.1 hypothetical protein R078131_00356 [Convivina intestini]